MTGKNGPSKKIFGPPIWKSRRQKDPRVENDRHVRNQYLIVLSKSGLKPSQKINVEGTGNILVSVLTSQLYCGESRQMIEFLTSKYFIGLFFTPRDLQTSDTEVTREIFVRYWPVSCHHSPTFYGPHHFGRVKIFLQHWSRHSVSVNSSLWWCCVETCNDGCQSDVVLVLS